MLKETMTMYRSDDGKLYETEELAKTADDVFEKLSKYTTFWVINHSPDLTEGRGYYGRTYVKVFNDSYIDTIDWMTDYCFNIYGKKITYVMGVSPIGNWNISQVEQEHWNNATDARVGDYKYKAEKLELSFNRGGLVDTQK